MSYPSTSNPWRDIRALVVWLDEHAQYGPETERILRCLKLSEEVGEVASAIIGATGQNPRKGVTHGWTDVEDELCDVIITAMVALTTISPNAEDKFAAHLDSITARSRLRREPTE
jgi:NTP pyrophosphatase (non-canonical NTP hydrolase)